ncbi:hypothetical protein [Niallia sp. RD1]|uniref:hypothetical protein n=1 Tax=Niallia sp. RD1 TaxID=2962858 RepID=UPI0020C194C8|nr:hypothetical protein [Niallia sp. RD1]UTI42122.1 hypothetical protein NKG37_25475 [Niallia sp. RD1]
MNSIQLRNHINEKVNELTKGHDTHKELDLAIDELDERCSQYAYDTTRLDNILMSFIGEYKLYDLFADHVEKLVKELDDPEDTYQVGKEMYGEDLADFIKQRPWLVGK